MLRHQAGSSPILEPIVCTSTRSCFIPSSSDFTTYVRTHRFFCNNSSSHTLNGIFASRDRGPTGIDDEENLPHEGAVIDIVHDTEEWTLEAGDETDSADEKDNVDKVLAE